MPKLNQARRFAVVVGIFTSIGVRAGQGGSGDIPLRQSWPAPPPTIEAACLDARVVVVGRIRDSSHEPYDMPTTAGPIRVPSTVYRVSVLSVLKDVDRAATGRSEVLFRHVGNSAGSRGGNADESIPTLTEGHEYLLILHKGTVSGINWLSLGGNSVFERVGGTVLPGGRSVLADSVRGMPWGAFIKACQPAGR
jgi:hypothetical protein